MAGRPKTPEPTIIDDKRARAANRPTMTAKEMQEQWKYSCKREKANLRPIA